MIDATVMSVTAIGTIADAGGAGAVGAMIARAGNSTRAADLQILFAAHSGRRERVPAQFIPAI